jgi:hypothetical protein
MGEATSTLERPAAPLWNQSGFAATWDQKVKRAFEIGPKYYALDLPRYIWHRLSLGLSPWDWGALLVNPLREFRRVVYYRPGLPPRYGEALKLFEEKGIQIGMPRPRLESLLGVWWETRGVAGDYIECGACSGATAMLVALLGKWNGVVQRTLMLDTFEGTPIVSRYDPYRTLGEYRLPADQVAVIEQQCRALGIDDRVEVHKGLFSETFPRLAARDLHFAFVHIDANVYPSTLEACRFALPRVRPGGAAVFDDYNGLCDLGARLAIDEFLAGSGKRPQRLAECSAYLRF